MQFTVSNNGTEWILGFRLDSVVLSVKDIDENPIISSLEIALAAWSLLLSQRQEFLNNCLPGVPITPNQQGTFKMREEVLSNVGAQDTNTRGYELSDLEHLEFSGEDPAVDIDSVYRPAANPIILDDAEDKEKSAPTTTTPESERPTEAPRLLRSRPFGIRLENVPDSVYRSLFL